MARIPEPDLGAGTVALAACSATASTGTSSTGASTTTTPSPTSSPSESATGTVAAAGEIPDETNGPYPADGSNGVNIFEESGIVRSDITSSLDGGTTVDGVNRPRFGAASF